MATYYDKLKMPQWRELRSSIIQERGHKCQRCGGSSSWNLELHHGYYKPATDPWDYEKSSLWLLCRNCHEAVQQLTTALHRTIGMLNPEELFRLKSVFEDAAFEISYGMSREEIDEILATEREHRSERYIGYSVSITSCNDLGPSIAYELAEKAGNEFPGILIDVIEQVNGRDALAQVVGPDDKICSNIQSWLDNVHG